MAHAGGKPAELHTPPVPGRAAPEPGKPRSMRRWAMLALLVFVLLLCVQLLNSAAERVTALETKRREAALALSAATAGAIYYVAPGGSDANPGSSGQPWATIQKAADAMAPGDTVIVRAGNYRERVRVRRSGISGWPITYLAEGAVTMRGFTVVADYIGIGGFDISDTPDDWDAGIGIFVQGSYCHIAGNYIHDATRGGISVWVYPGKEEQSRGCTIRNNRLGHNAMEGISVNGRGHLVEGNDIWGTIQYHPKWQNPPGSVDADGIRFFGSGHTIRANHIHDIHYGVPENVDPHIDCFQTWADMWHERASETVIERNRCTNLDAISPDAVGQGFMLESAADLTIRSNMIRAYRQINAVGSAHLTIVNNTFAGDLAATTAFGPGGVIIQNSPHAVIQNNVFYNQRGDIISVADDASVGGLRAGYNLAYRSDGRPPRGSPHPHDLWAVDPLFVDPAGGDFRLQAASPAVDAGSVETGAPADFDGLPRPQGAGFDMGAFEFPTVEKNSRPAIAQISDPVTFTVAFVASGRPMTVTDVLPPQFMHLSSASDCSGTVAYDGVAQRVTFAGTPLAGQACTVTIVTQVNASMGMTVTNTAIVENGLTPPQEASATVVLNAVRFYLPMTGK